jgi:hypothetical protein
MSTAQPKKKSIDLEILSPNANGDNLPAYVRVRTPNYDPDLTVHVLVFKQSDQTQYGPAQAERDQTTNDEWTADLTSVPPVDPTVDTFTVVAVALLVELDNQGVPQVSVESRSRINCPKM